ncbi:MMPL family transporter [Kitasatospora sp. NBC_01287]|uniref:MMPL family transporter n=1 Tax=Kitasatospora sp. NBC_01287 TaxID=2903573 RepID=UPI00225BA367|nr:MMPL family transporter [Kitasatospora sp. NBC_01287]MCX4745710.1 MMPL family transporter [Kitasatospora sp. NBC_01287]
MPTLLHRLGRFAFRHRRRVLALWLAVIAAVVGCMLAFGGPGKLDDTFSIPGSESQQALDRMKTDFPTSSGTSAQVVFTAPPGSRVTDPAELTAMRAALASAATAPQVAKVIDPVAAQTVSRDGSTAVAQVQYEVVQSALKPGSLDALKTAVDSAGQQQPGLDVQVGGAAFGSGPSKSGGSDLIGIGIAVVILALTFGSLLPAGLPLLGAIAGVVTAIAGVLAFTGVTAISSTAQSLALMIGLAVGIDYALFIVSRHRATLAQGTEPEESAALAVGTAGSAVVFAGLTVVIAMAGLSVVGIPYLTVMGLSAAAAVLVAVLVATTLLPALLGFAGARLRPKPGSRALRRELAGAGGSAAATGTAAAARRGPAANAGERWFRLVTRRPLLTLLAVLVAVGALAWPAHGLRLALPDNGTAAAGSSQRLAYDQVSKEFGPGFNGPLLVLADTSHSADPTAAAEKIAATVRALPDVAAVGKPVANPATHTTLLQVVPASAPSDQATKNLVGAIRGEADALHQQTGATIGVTGSTAVGIDVSAKLNAAMIPFAAVVVGLSLLLLLLVFRSLVVPVKAAAGFLLSVAATLGTVVSVFQHGHLSQLIGVDRAGPVSSFLPIILLAVLFGLAMDYEVFLVSRQREAFVHGEQPLDAVLSGGRHSARVVTAAALIMIAVFASFLASDSQMLKQIAFALAMGVLLDAFVIRMTFVPAVLALTGRAAWWLPRPLARLLPDLDIEGERLQHPTRAAESTPNPAPAPTPMPAPAPAEQPTV